MMRSRIWPSASQELLLRMALCPPSSFGDGWATAARTALDLIDRDRGSARLAPLVWANLERHGVRGPDVDRLRDAYRRTHVANRALFDHVAEVLDAMHAGGIATLVLKGPALVASYYRDPGLRPMDDFDILVPVTAAGAAIEVLGRLGWRPERPVGPVALAELHAVTFNAAGRPACDLHWHVMSECRQPRDDDDFWAASVPVEVAGIATRALAPADQLLHACLQADAWVRLPKTRWVADAVFITARAELDWARFVGHAVSQRFAERLRRQLTYLRATYDARIPPEPVDALARCGDSAFERVERLLREREWKGLRLVPFHAMNAVRASGRSWRRAPLTLLRSFQALWGLESTGDLPREIVRRLRREIRTTSAPSRGRQQP